MYSFKNTFAGPRVMSTEQYYLPEIDGGNPQDAPALVEVEAGTRHGSLNIYRKNQDGRYELSHRSALASTNPANPRGNDFSRIIGGQFQLNGFYTGPTWQDLQNPKRVLKPGQEGYPFASPQQIRQGQKPTFFPLAQVQGKGLMGLHTTASTNVFSQEKNLTLLKPGNGSTDKTGGLPSSGCLRVESAGNQALKKLPPNTPVMVKIDVTKQFYKKEGDNRLYLSYSPSAHNTVDTINGPKKVKRATANSILFELRSYQQAGFLQDKHINLSKSKIEKMLASKQAGDYEIGTIG